VEKNKDGFKLWYAISFAFQLGFIVVFPIVGFIVLGLWIDRAFNSTPLLLIVGVFVGFAVTVYEVYHFLIPLIESK